VADLRYCGSCAHAEKIPMERNAPHRHQMWAQFVLRCVLDNELVTELQYCDRWAARRG
jgi:hypothetical protein